MQLNDSIRKLSDLACDIGRQFCSMPATIPSSDCAPVPRSNDGGRDPKGSASNQSQGSDLLCVETLSELLPGCSQTLFPGGSALPIPPVNRDLLPGQSTLIWFATVRSISTPAGDTVQIITPLVRRFSPGSPRDAQSTTCPALVRRALRSADQMLAGVAAPNPPHRSRRKR